MNQRETRLADLVGQLQRAFDQSFAEPEATVAEAPLELLLIRVHGQGYALRLSHVAALHADRKLVSVPSPRPELLGLLGLRGQIAPVYDLGLMLGYGRRDGARWLVLAQSATPLALAFEQFEAHAHVGRDALVTAPVEAQPAARFLSGNVAVAGGVRPVIDLAALVAAVTDNGRQGAPEREERR